MSIPSVARTSSRDLHVAPSGPERSKATRTFSPKHIEYCRIHGWSLSLGLDEAAPNKQKNILCGICDNMCNNLINKHGITWKGTMAAWYLSRTPIWNIDLSMPTHRSTSAYLWDLRRLQTGSGCKGSSGRNMKKPRNPWPLSIVNHGLVHIIPCYRAGSPCSNIPSFMKQWLFSHCGVSLSLSLHTLGPGQLRASLISCRYSMALVLINLAFDFTLAAAETHVQADKVSAWESNVCIAVNDKT